MNAQAGEAAKAAQAELDGLRGFTSSEVEPLQTPKPRSSTVWTDFATSTRSDEQDTFRESGPEPRPPFYMRLELSPLFASVLRQ